MRRLSCAVLVVSAVAVGACSGSGSPSGASAGTAAKAACTEFSAHGVTPTAVASAATAAKGSSQWGALHAALADSAAQAVKAKSAATAIGTAQPSTDPNFAIDDATFKTALAAITKDHQTITAACATT